MDHLNLSLLQNNNANSRFKEEYSSERDIQKSYYNLQFLKQLHQYTVQQILDEEKSKHAGLA